MILNHRLNEQQLKVCMDWITGPIKLYHFTFVCYFLVILFLLLFQKMTQNYMHKNVMEFLILS